MNKNSLQSYQISMVEFHTQIKHLAVFKIAGCTLDRACAIARGDRLAVEEVLDRGTVSGCIV